MRGEVIRRVLFLALMAGMGIWAATYDGPAQSRSGRGDAPPPPASPSDAQAPEPKQVSAGDPSVGKAPHPVDGARDAGLRDSDRSPTHPGLTVAQARRREAIIAAARARTADNDARYARHQQLWNTEQRDAQWAAAKEEEIRRMLVESGVDHLLLDVTCRRTLCRMQTELVDSHSGISLMAVPGLIDAFGGDDNAYHFEGSPADGTATFLGPGRTP